MGASKWLAGLTAALFVTGGTAALLLHAQSNAALPSSHTLGTPAAASKLEADQKVEKKNAKEAEEDEGDDDDKEEEGEHED